MFLRGENESWDEVVDVWKDTFLLKQHSTNQDKKGGD